MKSPRQKRQIRSTSVGVIDIGSNSVRLVVYEAMERSLVTTFNEKALCGLGREVQSTGLLAADAVDKALLSLRRFRALCKIQKVGRVYAIATAACRDASNGPDFIAQATRICGVPIQILTGPEEARFSALGVISGIHKPDGIVGDLGGGSLELVDVRGHQVRSGITLPLGSLALQDLAEKSLKRAEKIAKDALSGLPLLQAGRGRTFYAVGGTWRALARIHIIQSGYPLGVMHGYAISAAEALDFVRRLRRLAATDTPLADVEAVAEARRPLLAYAALVLEHVIGVAKPKTIVFSTFGVREGLLYSKLPDTERAKDGLICAAQTLNELLSRTARHAQELIDWTDRFVRVVRLRETEDERRLRHAACLLSDIGWRLHPDHRGELTYDLILNGNFGAITHQGRIFIALSVFFRYAGIREESEPPQLMQTLTAAQIERARVLGAAFRVAHLISAARPGVLPATHFRSRDRKLMLVFDHQLVDLVADRVGGRFKQLARLVGRTGSIVRD